jgi:hypothetical protein
VAPIETLRLARGQFNHLALSSAKDGDIVSQTICEIGGCAIDRARAAGKPAKQAPSIFPIRRIFPV